MSEFASWIEKDDRVYFLVANQIFNTTRGKALQKYCLSSDDYNGHGAIRYYYGFYGGDNRECTDFSTPNNFPPEIVDAIKKGKFKGVASFPEVLLLLPLDDDYWAKCKLLYDEQWDLLAIPENRNPVWR